ncbi:hypothetical protein [Nocardia sp. NPDC057030]|uniref:hypothetical protein n=1 Tax=unclassified Nocardia TaxID=2637762 RepID=UPI0036443AE8
MSFDVVKVRQLNSDELATLTPDDRIYVTEVGLGDTVLVPANLYPDWPGLGPDRVGVVSIFGSQTVQSADAVYVADDTGTELPLLRTAGSNLSLSLFFAGMDAEEAQARLYTALRAEFGQGFIEVWNIKSKPVKDTRWDVYVPDEYSGAERI